MAPKMSPYIMLQASPFSSWGLSPAQEGPTRFSNLTRSEVTEQPRTAEALGRLPMAGADVELGLTPIASGPRGGILQGQRPKVARPRTAQCRAPESCEGSLDSNPMPPGKPSLTRHGLGFP